MTENILKFQPATKRFIAWDKYHKAWVTKFLMPSTSNEDSDDMTCPLTLGMDTKGATNWLNNDQLIICQSTNLFDKDGKEIFEGSILEQDLRHLRAGRKYHFIVRYMNAEFTAEPIDGAEFRPAMLPNTVKTLRNIGHIFSRPASLEDK